MIRVTCASSTFVTCTQTQAHRRPTAHQDFCLGTARICSTSNANCRQSIPVWRCHIGASTKRPPIYLPLTSSGSPTSLAPLTSVRTIRCSSGGQMEFRASPVVHSLVLLLAPRTLSLRRRRSPLVIDTLVFGTWKEIPTDLHTPASGVPSLAFLQPREIHFSFFFMPMSIGSGQSGNDDLIVSIGRLPHLLIVIPAIPSVTTCLTPCGLGMELLDLHVLQQLQVVGSPIPRM